jgi:hypothetical protein
MYSEALSTHKDLIRFLLQDTECPETFSDFEISNALRLYGDSMGKVLNFLCVALIAKASAKPQSEQVEGLTVTWGDMAKKYQSLQRVFSDMERDGSMPKLPSEPQDDTPIPFSFTGTSVSEHIGRLNDCSNASNYSAWIRT